MRSFIVVIASAVICLHLTGCSSGTEPREPLTIPAQYDSVAWAANATNEIAFVNDMTALLTELKKARTVNVKLDEAFILSKLELLQSRMTASDNAFMAGIVDLAIKASGSTMDGMKYPHENGWGGVYGRYLFTEFGLDIIEGIEKTLFSIALYRNAAILLDTAIPTVRNVDRALALFGASPSFPNSATDKFCANYAARRDKNDGSGFYTIIRDAFKKARAAAAAGSEYNSDYREAVNVVKRNWEASQMATTINYCYATVSTLSATNVTDSARSVGMHSLGEAVGFVFGWSRTEVSQRTISAAQLSSIRKLLEIDGNEVIDMDEIGSPFYHFWHSPATTLPALLTVTQQLQSVFGFSEAEMLDFKQNWVIVQGR